MIVHAGLVAWRLRGGWRGVLIQGPTGAGKSDLALRCLEAGARLVADDRVQLWRVDRSVFGRAPTPLSGCIEARGLDVLACPTLPFSQVVLSVSASAGREIDRVHSGAAESVLEIAIPTLALDLLEASAPLKLRLALERLGGAP